MLTLIVVRAYTFKLGPGPGIIGFIVKLQKNQVRIIAGLWRGRKINFPDLVGLRPSSDRVRETLFNWLQQELIDRHCLDLYAGSGVLGLEALSRGAASVLAVDESREATRSLQKNAETLQAKNFHCICASVQQALTQLTTKFDLVFIDPPFTKDLVESSCESLERLNLLSKNALVYVEMALSVPMSKFPANWELFREMQTQQVRALLFKRTILK
jgi:16S rRNA (guanine966-N2)-methyltransferase